MTLKQQFIQAYNFMARTASNYSEWELLDDSQYHHSDYPNQDACKILSKIKIDLCVCNPSEDVYFNICFNSKPTTDTDVELEYIDYINSVKGMYSVLDNIRYYMFNADNEKVKFVDKCDELTNYSEEFRKILASDFCPYINNEKIPIIFHKYGNYSGDFTRETKGDCITLYNSVINIYNVINAPMEDLQQTIRHEQLHYALNLCLLKNSDDDVIFHLLCKKYDAHSYVNLSDADQKIFNDYERFFIPNCKIDDLDDSSTHDLLNVMTYTLGKTTEKIEFENMLIQQRKQMINVNVNDGTAILMNNLKLDNKKVRGN